MVPSTTIPSIRCPKMVLRLGRLMITICSLASAAERPSPPLAANPKAPIALFPVNKCKLLSLVRHAQGFHNEAKANATRDNTHDPPHAVLFENTTGKLYWDADLTKKGRKQCNDQRLNLLVSESAFSEPEVVLVSPMRRTLHTATLIYGRGSRPFIATEWAREKIDAYVCEGRSSLSKLRKRYSHVDFSAVKTEEDTWFYDAKEDDYAVQRRARMLLQLVASRSEKHIAIVSHKHFLRNLLLQFSIPSDLSVHKPFENAEVRQFQFCNLEQFQQQRAESNPAAADAPESTSKGQAEAAQAVLEGTTHENTRLEEKRHRTMTKGSPSTTGSDLTTATVHEASLQSTDPATAAGGAVPAQKDTKQDL